MTTERTQLAGGQIGTLRAICGIGATTLSNIAMTLAAGELLVSTDQIKKLIVDLAGEADGEQLHTFLMSLAAASRRDETSPNAMLSNVSEIVARSHAEDPSLRKWSDCEPILHQMLRNSSIRAAAKALQVSYDFERVFLEGRFLTSIRPIFDDDRKKIVAAAIVQTLRIDYMSSEGERATISLAFDRADIEQLRNSCILAIQKGDIAFDQTMDAWKLPTMMPGLNNE